MLDLARCLAYLSISRPLIRRVCRAPVAIGRTNLQLMGKLMSILANNRERAMNADPFTSSAPRTASAPKRRIWAGRILTAIPILFLLFDGVTKVMLEQHGVGAMP